jgi:hypothetical protein
MSALDIGSGYVPDFIRNEVLPNLPRQSGALSEAGAQKCGEARNECDLRNR